MFLSKSMNSDLFTSVDALATYMKALLQRHVMDTSLFPHFFV